MRIYIPAWHYRARAVVQRTWGWSPVEEMVLLALDRTPGTIDEIAESLNVLPQIVGSTVARLMQFGLVEVRRSPRPVLATSTMGQDFIRAGRALPERTSEREVGISLVLEKVGHSVFRNRDVSTVPLTKVGRSDRVVPFPVNEIAETDETMAQRVSEFVGRTLRPGEWLRGVQITSSMIERKFLELELEDVKDGMLPDGASRHLVKALKRTIKTSVLPRVSITRPKSPLSVETNFDSDDLIVGSSRHVEAFEQIVGAAKTDVFVLSTFVASQSDERGKAQRERIWRALEHACQRGVRCHLFFGTALDEGRKNAIAIEELRGRLAKVRQAKGFVLVQRDPVGSHAKLLAADDGQGGAVVVTGSCNWLSSPFSAVEVSAELRESSAAALGLDLLRAIVVSLSSASRSVEILQFMASELRRSRSALTSIPDRDHPKARLTILQAHEHERLLRKAAHEAATRFVCCTNRIGATMVPALFNPAEIAGRRLDEVRVYYSRQTGPTKRRHVVAHRERLHEVVDLIGVREPQLHAKFLLWDDDHVVVSSMNWGSQSGLADKPLDEIGIYLKGENLAAQLLKTFDICVQPNSAEDEPAKAPITQRDAD